MLYYTISNAFHFRHPIISFFTTAMETAITVFENHSKSLIDNNRYQSEVSLCK